MILKQRISNSECAYTYTSPMKTWNSATFAYFMTNKYKNGEKHSKSHVAKRLNFWEQTNSNNKQYWNDINKKGKLEVTKYTLMQ